MSPEQIPPLPDKFENFVLFQTKDGKVQKKETF